MSNTLLRIYPSDLKMPFELKKQNSGCLELINKTDQSVAFKVKTTNPRKYAVRPASGVVLPRGSCGVTITMQAPKEIPPDYHCKDKFLVQSIIVEDGTMQKDVVPGMFSKEPGKLVEEFKLRVVYIPANPPSPVPEEAEEEDESLDSDVDHEVERASTSNTASGHGHTSGSQASHDEDVSSISESEDQESRYAEENQKLQEELESLRLPFPTLFAVPVLVSDHYLVKAASFQELLRKRKPAPGVFSAAFVLLVFSLSFLVGYLMLGSKA